MNCNQNYIALNRDYQSRSGLFASDLPGVEDLLYELISKDSETISDVWERIYSNAWANLISDVDFSLQEKFFVNTKLISRETSQFLSDVNSNTGLAGVRIQFQLPRYARLHVVSVDVIAEEGYASPGIALQFYEDDENGDLLYETTDQSISEAGKETIFVDKDFDVCKLFVAFDPALYQLRQTENKEYAGFISKFSALDCLFPCFGGTASVRQINGGGLNVVFNVYCSAEKFVCQNLNLFKKTFWYKIGQELIVERRYGNRLNQFTTMTQERAEELTNFYQAQYTQSLKNSIDAHNINEDPICFECKGTVNYKTNLP